MENDENLNQEGLPGDTEPGFDQFSNEKNENGHKKNSRSILRYLLIVFVSLLTFVLLIVFVIYLAPGLQEVSSVGKSNTSVNPELKKDAGYKNQINLMSKDIQRLSRKYNTYTTGQSYIVINTTDNKFSLYKNKVLVREGICSSGANKILKTEKRTYFFKTPKGKFSITGKRKHPYWHRSDWDFIEQGLPVPPKDDPSRWEEGVLGDYALDLVDGYMIHGTLYPLLMGMPVTHGCVRLLDEDLEIVFNTLNIGSKVYIF
jgi:hypothetical protein